MNDSEFRETMKEFEGFATHMYLDTKGLVTIGTGIMFPTSGAAKNSGIKFTNRETGKKATPQEIEADYNTVKKAPKKMLAKRYEAHTKLDGGESALDKEFNSRLNNAKSGAKAYFKDFAKLPSSVQYALIDMAYNLGNAGLKQYRKLNVALEKAMQSNKPEDWQSAAKESHRTGPSEKRNKAIFDWIVEGGKARKTPE